MICLELGAGTLPGFFSPDGIAVGENFLKFGVKIGKICSFFTRTIFTLEDFSGPWTPGDVPERHVKLLNVFDFLFVGKIK
jgi:hypothetical protein